jgi:glycosidase
MFKVLADRRRPASGMLARIAIGAGVAGALALTSVAAAQPAGPRRGAEDEVVYFLLPDRFANGDTTNDRGGIASDDFLVHGFEPTRKGFYNGGDLAGLIARLDYIQGLGATAIWLAPVFRNKPVQGPAGQQSAGYHGYWITDFTDVDPHFGTRAQFKAFVDAAHARGMKVYMDIITNHTADVIQYRECFGKVDICAYRSKADYPLSRRGGIAGAPINSGFAGEGVPGARNWANFKDPTAAYTPFIPAGEENARTPAWLNDLTMYHNRGDSTFTGESSTHGDFAGLDDLNTEHPRVLQGLTDVYSQWIRDYKVDGFRIDTVKHVNLGFWRSFMPAIAQRARAAGVRDFYSFGEVYDPDPVGLARFTREASVPHVLDFGFQAAVTDVVAKGAGTDRLERLFQADSLYEGGAAGVLRMPTFLGNHDLGRFARFVREANPNASDDEQLARVKLGHAMLMFLRGVPVIYYGDEQGFAGDGHDQDARETLFASRVASYNDNRLVGTTRTTATDNYNTDHPLYRAFGDMARVRSANPVLRRGVQTVRSYGSKPGLFAVSRTIGNTEAIVAFNTSATPIRANIEVNDASRTWRSAYGVCPGTSAAPQTISVEIASFGAIVCISDAAN